MKKKTKTIIILSIAVFFLLTFLISIPYRRIKGYNYALIKESGTDKVLIILKSIGVKRITDVKTDYESNHLKTMKIGIDGERTLSVDLYYEFNGSYFALSNISVSNNNPIKFKDIDSSIDSDEYAYYYDRLQNQVITLDNQIITQEEAEKKTILTSVNIFERYSGFIAYNIIPIFFVSLTALIIYLAIRSSIKKEKRKAEFLKENDAISYLSNVTYRNGITTFVEGESVNIFICDDQIKIQSNVDDKKCLLKYKQIVAAGIFTDTQIFKNTVTKNGSVIGNGILGGILFGPAGMFLGAASSIGSKTKTVTETVNTYYIIINYHEKNSKTVKSISFSYDRYRGDAETFISDVKERITVKDVEL